MKHKFILISLVTFSFLINGNLLFAGLEAGSSDDEYEREADKVADQRSWASPSIYNV